MFRALIVFIAAISFSSLVMADGHGHHRSHGHHYGHHPHHFRHHGRHGHFRPHYAAVRRGYYSAPPVHYYPAPRMGYAPMPPQPVYRYDRRTSSGMVGGVVGSAMGYQFGGGDPLAAGIGAAAGSWIGNGIR